MTSTWTSFALAVVLASAPPTMPEAKNGDSAMPLRGPLFDRLASEAQAATTTPDGMRIYAIHLNALLLRDSVRDPIRARFLKRFENANARARTDDKAWVSESSIASAFNRLVLELSGSNTGRVQVDSPGIHEIRSMLFAYSHSLSTIDTHASECMPSEAVLVLLILIWNNGAPEHPLTPSATRSGTVTVRDASNDVRVLLDAYTRTHPMDEVELLYDNLAKEMTF